MTDDHLDFIYHVSDQQSLSRANETGSYACDSLDKEGFIHCCKKQQLTGVLERYYQGVTDLRVLEIEVVRLTSKLVYENTVGGAELFPHVYGAINMDAVTDVVNL